MIRGITVTLFEKQKTGEDAFGAPIWKETQKPVANVLVGEPTTDDVVSSQQLYGKRVAYVLALPKGDVNVWDNVTVEFWGQKFRTFGGVTQGIDSMVPGPWNRKVRVERFE